MHMGDYWPNHCGDSDGAAGLLALEKKEAIGAAHPDDRAKMR